MIKKQTIVQYLFNYISQVVLVLAPLVVIPHVSRVLGAVQIGMYSYTQSYVSTFLVVCTLGMGLYAQRETARVRSNVTLRSQLVLELTILRVIVMLIGIAIYVIMFSLMNDNAYKMLFVIQLIDIVAGLFDVTWLYYAIDWYKKLAVINIVVKLGYVFFALTLIQTREQLWLYVLLHALATFIGNILMCILCSIHLKWTKVTQINIIRHIKPIVVLFVPQVAVQVYTVLDKSMLGWLAKDMSQNGYYEQASKIVHTVLMLITSFGVVMLSDNAKMNSASKEELAKKAEEAIEFILVLAIPVMLGCIAVSEEITDMLLGYEFKESSLIICILAMNIVIIAISNVTGIQYLVVLCKQKEYTVSIVFGAIANIIFNFIFIPKWKACGAATANVIAEIVVLSIQVVFVRNDIRFSKDKSNNVFKCLLSGFMMFFLVGVVSISNHTTLTTIVFKVAIGVLFYLIFLVILQERYCLTVLEYLKKRYIRHRK